MRAILPLSCLVGTLAGCRPSGPPQEMHARQPPLNPPTIVTTAQIQSQPVDQTLPVVGTLFPKDEATLSAEVEGIVEKTSAEFGDRVKAGQELARIDTDSYTALAAQATARVAQARAAAVSAEHELHRQQELQRNGIASPADLDLALANAEQTRAAVKAAEAAETVARLNLGRSRIHAPFDAAIADRIANAGDFVRPGSPLFRIVNDGILKFIVQAPEAAAPKVAKGQEIRFNVDAYPGRTFTGQVFLISPQVSTTTRMFPLGALVTNLDRTLKASTFARGELVLERAVPTVLAPLEAIATASGFSRVFVITNGVARSRDISVGRVLGTHQEVLRGLAPGEIVATSGLTKLQDGLPVTLRSEAR